MHNSRWSLTGWLLYLIYISPLLPAVSHAAEWSLLETVSLGAIYTDNANLVEEDAIESKESDLIGVVAPGIVLRGDGRRVNVDLALSLIFNTGDENPILPRWRAFLGTELVKNNFFFDAYTTANQGRINPFAAAGSPVVNQTGNFTTIYQYTLNPYFVSRLNGFADLNIDYKFSDYYFSDDDVDPRRRQSLRANLFTDSREKISWGLDAFTRKVEYESDTQADSTRSYADAVLRYRLDRKWRFAGSIGTESNDYVSDTEDETGGARWYLEASWTPNSRNTFRIKHGDRYFGPYTNLLFSHRARKSVFRLSYRTTLRDSTDNISDQDNLADTDLTGQPSNQSINDSSGQPNDFVDLSDNGVYVSERFKAYYTLTGKRTVFNLGGQYENRDYQDTPTESNYSRAWIQANRGLTRKYSLRTRLAWRGTEDKTTDRTSDTWRFILGLNRPVGRESGLSLQYSHADRDSNFPGDSYKENRVSLFFNTNNQGIPGYGGGYGRGFGGFWF